MMRIFMMSASVGNCIRGTISIWWKNKEIFIWQIESALVYLPLQFHASLMDFIFLPKLLMLYWQVLMFFQYWNFICAYQLLCKKIMEHLKILSLILSNILSSSLPYFLVICREVFDPISKKKREQQKKKKIQEKESSLGYSISPCTTKWINFYPSYIGQTLLYMTLKAQY